MVCFRTSKRLDSGLLYRSLFGIMGKSLGFHFLYWRAYAPVHKAVVLCLRSSTRHSGVPRSNTGGRRHRPLRGRERRKGHLFCPAPPQAFCVCNLSQSILLKGNDESCSLIIYRARVLRFLQKNLINFTGGQECTENQRLGRADNRSCASALSGILCMWQAC